MKTNVTFPSNLRIFHLFRPSFKYWAKTECANDLLLMEMCFPFTDVSEQIFCSRPSPFMIPSKSSFQGEGVNFMNFSPF